MDYDNVVCNRKCLFPYRSSVRLELDSMADQDIGKIQARSNDGSGRPKVGMDLLLLGMVWSLFTVWHHFTPYTQRPEVGC